MKNYLGSKNVSGLYQGIIAAMPYHDTYIETHTGTGHILKKKPKANRSIAIEINPTVLHSLPSGLADQMICGNCHDFLQGYSFTGKELVYCDPPYLLSTRTSNKRYEFDYTIEQHKELLSIVKKINAQVMISGYPSELYYDELSTWHALTFKSMTRGGPRTECLWMNVKPGENPHWHTYAGHDFTDRQRIKRKAESWKRRYQALPPGEKLAILSAMLSEDFS